jgi:hypothetical protein
MPVPVLRARCWPGNPRPWLVRPDQLRCFTWLRWNGQGRPFLVLVMPDQGVEVFARTRRCAG